MKLRETLTEMQMTLTGIKKDLGYHIKRTDLLEEKTELHREEYKEWQEKHFEPVEQHVKSVRFLFKAIAYLVSISAGIAALIWTILKLSSH